MKIPHAPGTYRLHVGPCFYVGSTSDLRRRWLDHRNRLRQGEHPVADLQVAWWGTEGDDLRMEVVEVMPRKPYERDKALRKRLRLHEQWLLDAEFGTPGCVNRSQESGFNADIGEIMRRKWQDPVFREKQIALMQEGRRAKGLSKATREKMSKAKRGGRNARARACVIRFEGMEHRFDCVSDAARRLGVKQQVLDLWLKGKNAWPGQGRRTNYPQWIGLTGEFVE